MDINEAITILVGGGSIPRLVLLRLLYEAEGTRLECQQLRSLVELYESEAATTGTATGAVVYQPKTEIIKKPVIRRTSSKKEPPPQPEKRSEVQTLAPEQPLNTAAVAKAVRTLTQTLTEAGVPDTRSQSGPFSIGYVELAMLALGVFYNASRTTAPPPPVDVARALKIPQETAKIVNNALKEAGLVIGASHWNAGIPPKSSDIYRAFLRGELSIEVAKLVLVAVRAELRTAKKSSKKNFASPRRGVGKAAPPDGMPGTPRDVSEFNLIKCSTLKTKLTPSACGSRWIAARDGEKTYDTCLGCSIGEGNAKTVLGNRT